MNKSTLPLEYPAKGRSNKCSFLDLLTSFEVIQDAYFHVRSISWSHRHRVKRLSVKYHESQPTKGQTTKGKTT